jgi:hypothetical protein
LVAGGDFWPRHGAERLGLRRQLPDRVWQAAVVLVWGGFGA